MTPPRPDLFRVLVRSVAACVLVEVVTLAALRSTDATLEAWAYVLGWGLGAGAALAVAEAALWRWGLVAALLAGACLSPLAPLGGAFELAFIRTWSSREATQAVLVAFEEPLPLEWLGHALGAVCVFGPLLLALRRRASPRGQALAMAVGATCWAGLVFVVGPWALSRELTWRELPILLLVPALVAPPARRLGDQLARRLRGRARAPRAAAASSRGLTLGALAALTFVPLLAHEHGSAAAIEPARERYRAEAGGVPALVALGERRASAAAGHRAPWRRRWLPPDPELECATLGIAVEDLAALRVVPPAPTPVTPRWRPMGDTLVPDHDDALGWFRAAAARGDLVAMRRLVEELDLPRHVYGQALPADRLEAAGWLRQAATAGDPPSMVTLGYRLAEGPWASLTDWGPPPPGEQPAAILARALEGLDWLRAARARSAPGATTALVRGLRLSPSATLDEAFARLDEARAICASTPLRPEEVAAVEGARAALETWRARR